MHHRYVGAPEKSPFLARKLVDINMIFNFGDEFGSDLPRQVIRNAGNESLMKNRARRWASRYTGSFLETATWRPPYVRRQYSYCSCPRHHNNSSSSSTSRSK